MFKRSFMEELKLFQHPNPLICMGDDPNDLEMLKLADIAITMGNTKIEELKEISNLITHH
ncbi:Conserved hypothetical protein [Candidatus Phytoplasma australiense]|uniref:Uncharacterized protein n=3 Tax=Phytoplasma australiense TaxID=59748 RepID=B1V9E3_PHYAS|nr:Hydrolase Haloacid Dehalogenase-Like Family [Strawberry lethal yellows phytoplasma (CPA) str. NZSb11]CAM11344.1 Conserved hypothetical protein [Candidatus Phytoplasma australiense]